MSSVCEPDFAQVVVARRPQPSSFHLARSRYLARFTCSMATSARGLGTRLAAISLRAWHPKWVIDAANGVRQSATQMGIKMSGTIHLPTRSRKALKVLKSPHVHSKHMRLIQYQQDTHKRLIQFYGDGHTGQRGAAAACASETKVVHFLRYLQHTILILHPGCWSRVILYSDECIEKQEEWRRLQTTMPAEFSASESGKEP